MQANDFVSSDESSNFFVKYVGSFMVEGDDTAERMNCVRMNLDTLRRTVLNTKSVRLEVWSSGIRVVSVDGQTVHMVHSLKRVSYATCDPDSCQFAFSARQPSSPAADVSYRSKAPPFHPLPGVQYCHGFLTDSPEQARRINDRVSAIFREAERAARHRPESVYCDFSKNSNDPIHDEKGDTFHSSTSSASASSSTFSGVASEINGDEQGVLLDRKRGEKQIEDLRAEQIIQNQGHFPINQPVQEEPQSDTMTVTPPGFQTRSPFAESNAPEIPARRARHPPVPHLDDALSRSLISDHNSSRLQSRTVQETALPGRTGGNGVTEDRVKSPLRPESKRHKRRALSAVLTNFGGANRRTTNTAAVTNKTDYGSSRRTSAVENAPENNKNGSILKRLLHLKLGGGSSLRLNLLTDKSSCSIVGDRSKQAWNGRQQRPAQSVRVLGHGLDQTESGTASCNAQLLPITTKRHRRPLSAVFGSSFQSSNGGPNGIGHSPVLKASSHCASPIAESSALETPSASKKLGSARSAVSKMFGFSSSRRKSRSSVQLDMIRGQYSLSTDLPSSCSTNSDRDSNCRAPLSFRPSMDMFVPQNDPTGPATFVTNGNDSCSVLGSGVGCGEQCSISMPNLRCGSELSLPLSFEEEMKLNGAAWFYGTISRQLAAEILENELEGAFIVRRSINQGMSLVLSVRVPPIHNPSGVSHYLILHTAKGFKLKGFTKDFPSIHVLVTHHSVMAEQLPCRLLFTERSAREARFHSSAVLSNDHQSYQIAQYQRRPSQSRHSSPFVNKRHDLVPVTEEESVYGKLPSSPALTVS